MSNKISRTSIVCVCLCSQILLSLCNPVDVTQEIGEILSKNFQHPSLPVKQSTSKCEVNPAPPKESEDKFTAPEIIYAAGFPNETHTVITDDNYILTLHRIRNDGRPPLLLMHGILSSSRDYLMQRGNNSLAYQLWLWGYDVWLGNMRGNLYSRSHVDFPDPENSPLYWDFSLDDIVRYDMPAFINYILNTTNTTTLQCVGFSLGTTVYMGLLAKYPEHQSKCECFTGLAPVATLHHIKTLVLKIPAAFLLPEEPLKSFFYEISPTGELYPGVVLAMIHKFIPTLCTVDPLELCLKIPYALLGPPDAQQIDREMEPKIFAAFPTSTSARTVVQIGFTAFWPRDFHEYWYQNPEENLRHYNQSTPPLYNLSNINRTPVTLWLGKSDLVATILDVSEWGPRLGVSPDINIINYAGWTHLDFMYAKNACEILYNPAIQKLRSCRIPNDH